MSKIECGDGGVVVEPVLGQGQKVRFGGAEVSELGHRQNSAGGLGTGQEAKLRVCWRMQAATQQPSQTSRWP